MEIIFSSNTSKTDGKHIKTAVQKLWLYIEIRGRGLPIPERDAHVPEIIEVRVETKETPQLWKPNGVDV